MFLEIKYWFAYFMIWLSGWKEDKDHHIELESVKNIKKIMIIGEPHTHILDFFVMLFIFWYFKFENLKFFITSKYMYPGVSLFMNFVGAIWVENKKSKNSLVDNIIDEINKREKITLQIGPSGTRKKTDKWRSGFYHIAHKSDIPILCFYIDSKTKTFGFVSPFKLTGNYKQDMDRIRLIYKDKNGLNKDNNSIIMIKEELDNIKEYKKSQ